MDEVPGFMARLDAELFVLLADIQRGRGEIGDVLEIGAWHGRSAILLAYLLDPRERLHVCDLFETPPPTAAGRKELARGGTPVPTRLEFEEAFLRFHPKLPVVHQTSSSDLAPKLGVNSVRFAHIDGSHLYDAVLGDIQLVRSVVRRGGVIVFDDFANIGHLGVAAALWPALGQMELEPFACTPAKLYAAIGARHAAEYRQLLEARLGSVRHAFCDVNGTTIVTLWPSIPPRNLVTRCAGRIRASLGMPRLAARHRRGLLEP